MILNQENKSTTEKTVLIGKLTKPAKLTLAPINIRLFKIIKPKTKKISESSHFRHSLLGKNLFSNLRELKTLEKNKNTCWPINSLYNKK